MLKLILIELASCLTILPSKGWRFGICTKITDGDTVKIKTIWGLRNCRLADIDAPETDQPYGSESTEALKRFVLGRKIGFLFSKTHHCYPESLVLFKVTSQDKRYGRDVIRLSRLPYWDINKEMVRLGMAWAYPQYIKEPQRKRELVVLQDKAENKRLGLWKGNNPIHPQEWRRKH